MPRRPKTPCKHPGCPELTHGKYCEEHTKLYANERGSAASRGYNSRWRAARKRFLKANPLCAYCLLQNRMIEAVVVDHIEPHRGDPTLFWNESNWQPLCKKCHDTKTMTTDRYQEYKY